MGKIVSSIDTIQDGATYNVKLNFSTPNHIDTPASSLLLAELIDSSNRTSLINTGFTGVKVVVTKEYAEITCKYSPYAGHQGSIGLLNATCESALYAVSQEPGFWSGIVQGGNYGFGVITTIITQLSNSEAFFNGFTMNTKLLWNNLGKIGQGFVVVIIIVLIGGIIFLIVKSKIK